MGLVQFSLYSDWTAGRMMTKKSWFTSWQGQVHMLKRAAGLQTPPSHQKKKKKCWCIIPCDLN